MHNEPKALKCVVSKCTAKTFIMPHLNQTKCARASSLFFLLMCALHSLSASVCVCWQSRSGVWLRSSDSIVFYELFERFFPYFLYFIQARTQINVYAYDDDDGKKISSNIWKHSFCIMATYSYIIQVEWRRNAHKQTQSNEENERKKRNFRSKYTQTHVYII